MGEKEEKVITSLIMEDLNKKVQISVLMNLLIQKGIITMDEYEEKYRDAMLHVAELGEKQLSEFEQK